MRDLINIISEAETETTPFGTEPHIDDDPEYEEWSAARGAQLDRERQAHELLNPVFGDFEDADGLIEGQMTQANLHPDLIPTGFGNFAEEYVRSVTYVDTPDGIDLLIAQLKERHAMLRRAGAGSE